jgi:DNA-binding NtrC family response regulator
MPILLLDDEEYFRSALVRELRSGGINNLVSTGDPEIARSLVSVGGASLTLLDLQMPAASGEELLAEFVDLAPQIPVIVITGDSAANTVVRCMKAGALDYLVKPVETSRLLAAVRNGLAIVELRLEVSAFREKMLGGLSKPELFHRIVTRDSRMISLFKYIEAIAPSRHPVLITGETGTGKELFARAVHEASGRSGAFVAVNVGGLDDTVFTDTLFGHKKGAYTGANDSRPGLVSEARGGSLFLDEIGDLEPHSQIKLLRLLQEGEYFPLGSDFCLKSEARIIAATAQDIKTRPAFRSDLYYRLQTHLIAIPPLRERPDDIDLLIDYFLTLSAESLSATEPPELPPEGRETLAVYDFPGNIRELESIIHDAVARAGGGAIDATALRERLPPERRLIRGTEPPAAGSPYGGSEIFRLIGERFPTLHEVEGELVRKALSRAQGNVSIASSLLGISRQTIYNWLAEYENESIAQ